MAMRALLIDDAVRQNIRGVMRHADARRLSMDALKEHIKRKHAIGDDPLFAVNIPFGFRAVYSVEQQPTPLGWCRHISISVPNLKGPNPFAVAEILTAFGFTPLPGENIIAAYQGREVIKPVGPVTWLMYLEANAVVNVLEQLTAHAEA